MPTWVTTTKVSVRRRSGRSVEPQQRRAARPAAAGGRAGAAPACPLIRSIACSPFAADADQLDHADLRDGEALAGALDDQGRDDRQGQRDLDDEGRALALASSAARSVPPIFSMLVLTTSMPTPRPETLVTCGGGREAGAEDEVLDLLLASSRPARPRSRGRSASAFCLDPRRRCRPRPSSRDLDDDVAALVVGVQRDAAGLRLAGGAGARPASPGRGRPSCGPCGSAGP